MTPLRVHSATHPGLHHPRNEDTHTVLTTPDGVLLAVCDGMGGMGRADEASRLAIEVLSGQMVAASGPPADRLRTALKAADVRVRDELCIGSDRPGATAVLAFVHEGAAHVAWVGDSRAYLVRGGQVVARTRDHKLVEELVDAGQLTPEEAKESPLSHVVTRALGGRSPNEPPVQPAAFGYPWPLHTGDVLVLCSDGVCDLLTDGELAAMTDQRAPSEAVSRLVEAALLRGGHDNITVIVAQWEGAGAVDPLTPVRPPERSLDAAPRVLRAPIGDAPGAARLWLGAGVTLLVLALIAALSTVARA